MSGPVVDHLILDAHGVCFNNPFGSFLATLAGMTGQRPDEVQRLWSDELRTRAWLGDISDEELWRRLTGSLGDTECWQVLLETHYRPGPVARHLKRWRSTVPLWVMSNHRTAWLHRRIRRYELAGCFERVFISEDVGFVKPDKRFFERVANRLPDRGRALFIDDQPRNIEAARQAGMQALCVDEPHLPGEVERRIGLASSPDADLEVTNADDQRGR